MDVSSSPRQRTNGVIAAVTSAGGVTRRTVLRAAGHADRAVSRALARGELLGVGRSWLALPGTDPLLLEAARMGVVLTCITAARRHGLWTFEEHERHVGAHPHRRKPPVHRSAVVHWAQPIVPRHPHRLIDSIENTLVIAASCQPFESALTIWESAIRKGLVDPFLMARMPLPGAARRVLEAASPYSDSGLETLIVPRLRWMGVRIIAQVWLYGHRVDFLIGDRLALQIDGGHHVDAQRAEDIRHDAELMLRGYHVIRVGYAQVVHDWPVVQDLIMRAIAQGLHLAR